MFQRNALIAALAALLAALPAHDASGGAGDLILPQGLSSYYTHQSIELAVAGLQQGEQVDLKLTPTNPAAAATISFPITGDGGTVTVALPANALAPGEYQVLLGDAAKTKVHIVRGVWPSRMYVSQVGAKPGEGGMNFINTNAFSFGLASRDLTGPTTEPRKRSTLTRWENDIRSDIPALIYMYWTGYVLHKPWGIHKEWASADMIENMRLFNFHVAQRMRRFDHLMISIGSIDEPGLPWGRTAAGGSASGFTGWNVADWLAERGMQWTDDPGSLPEADFRRYMQLRALMLRDGFQQASRDIKTVWPTAVYATDSYAPQAVGDGTDPMNQIANDIPTTHVFADYGIGKLGVLAGMYVEKAHDPTSKIAHAMNGQLFGFGKPMGHPHQLHAYHLMMNVMLAAGLDSNWWLNFWQIGLDENGKRDNALMNRNLEAVNEPAGRVGPLFHEVAPRDHDVAVLWSTSEIWMRVKGVMQYEASNADGKQKALMVADMPEDAIGEDGKLKYNAYSVGGNYKGEVMAATMAINRAGYPVHILHEQRLADALRNYKVLVIIHQTHELPAAERQAIEQWMVTGGTLIVDKSSTVKFDGARLIDAPSIVNQGYAWSGKFISGNKPGDLTRDKSYHVTNHFMESFSREAAPVFRAALAQTRARQVMKTDSVELACERHVGGAMQLIMVVNGYEKLPDNPADQPYVLWNYAPYEATYSLPIITPEQVVYAIEGLDWKTVRKLDNPTAAQTASFAPGEMKLYLVVPQAPTALDLTAALAGGVIDLRASLPGLASPWPLHVEIRNPAGEVITTLHRAMDERGRYRESIPLGLSAAAGSYVVTVSSPAAGLSATATVEQAATNIRPQVIAGPVRVFDEQPMRQFLAGDPALTIVVGDAAQQAVADKLAAGLSAVGVKATVKPEAQVMRKALYPRVWDPYAPLHRPTATAKPLPQVTVLDEKRQPVRGEDGKPVMKPGEAERSLLITSEYYETPTVTTADGQPFTGKWNEPGTLLTVSGAGYVQINGQEEFFEPGVKIFIGDRSRPFVVNSEVEQVKTDDAFRRRWARPWQRIIGHVGGFNLTPQLPEVYEADDHLVLLGDSTIGTLTAALQAGELLGQVVDVQYPGPGKALVQFAWSPFRVERNVIYIGATDDAGLQRGVERVIQLAAP